MNISKIKQLIPNSKKWTDAKEITFGWSGERKFKITTSDGEKLLLRILSFEQKEKQEKGILFLEKCNKSIHNSSILLDKGNTTDNKNYYLLLNWIEGEDGMKAIEVLPEETQYKLGIVMGKTIKDLHNLTTPIIDDAPSTYIATNIIEYIEGCREYLTDYTPLKSLTERIERDINIIKTRPVVMIHNDFHLGNMVIDKDNISLIDFNRARLGDNIKEFDCIAWSATHSIPFAVGLLDEYLKDDDIEEFFKLHRLYVTIWQVQMLFFIKEETEEEKRVVMDLINFTNTWYDSEEDNIPNWYRKNNKLGIK